ncbi:xylose isomerase-like protein [Dipodascopsis tothii]|uniref:xylose isomerase-like protein n=1 Tax=Dipodascopsis tothii TaxID=44089 RepID=UPI0034CE6503
MVAATTKIPPAVQAVFPVAIPSMDLGRAPVHELADKLPEAKTAGYQGIEVFYEDLKLLAQSYPDGTFEERLYRACEKFRALCDELGMAIIGLGPFKNYDGRVDVARHAHKMEKLRVWCRMCDILGTDLIQVPTNYKIEGTTGDIDVLVKHMRELADYGLAREPKIRFAYEALSWGTHADTWQRAWEVIERADRPNLGLCMDTFHYAAVVWADCTSESGVVPDADARLAADLAEFARRVPPERVFYVQLNDGQRCLPPLSPAHPAYNPSMKYNMMWSRSFRIFPCEQELGGYLPLERIMHFLLFEFGYRGWVSMEIFQPGLYEPDASVPRVYAQRGMKGWLKTVESLGLAALADKTVSCA